MRPEAEPPMRDATAEPSARERTTGRRVVSRFGLSALVFVLALGVLLVVSKRTAPSSAELATLAAIDAAGEVVKQTAARGFGALRAPEYRPLLEPGPLVLFGAWAKLSVGRLGVLDGLSAMRLPWLVFGALATSALFGMLRRARDFGTGALAATLLLALPRFSHAVVVTKPSAVLACVYVLVLSAYLAARARDTGARARVAWAVVAALWLGFGVAVSLASLWVLLLVLVHHTWVERESTHRLWRKGQLPLPPFVLVTLPVAPLFLLGFRPELWGSTPAVIARHLLAPLEPSVVRTVIGGNVVDRLPVPSGLALSELFFTLPVIVTALALVGLCVAFHGLLARRFASGALRPPRDRFAIGALAALGVAGVLVGPLVTPDVLVSFPPRVELAAPFVAIAAALGLSFASGRIRSKNIGRAVAAAVAGVWLVLMLVRSPTASAATSPLLGGGSVAARVLVEPDGSELGALASAFDALGQRELAVACPPDVSPELWRRLFEAGRMRTRVNVVPGAPYVLLRGPASGSGVAEVRRDGLVLWTLSASGGR